MTLKSVLIVLHLPKGVLSGGHVKSAFETANALSNEGIETMVLTNTETPLVQLLNANVTIIPDSANGKFSGYIYKYHTISRLINTKEIDLIISFDKFSTYHVSYPCAVKRIPLLPIIPGGDPSLFKIAPLQLTKYISFSQESIDALVHRYNFKLSQFILNPARFYLPEVNESFERITTEKIKIAYLTGLRAEKLSSYKHFINELRTDPSESISIDIIGEGPNEVLFKKESENYNFIHFKGFGFITWENMRQYDLVVTMGRGVVECLNFNIPTAICGHDGYIGLVDEINYKSLISTNFTGRGLKSYSNLRQDLEAITQDYKVKKSLVKTLRSEFSNRKLVKTIEECYNAYNLIPFDGNGVKALVANINSIISRIR